MMRRFFNKSPAWLIN